MIESNWKFAVDNLCERYHPQITHVSAFTPGVLPGLPPEAMPPMSEPNVEMDGAAKADGSAMRLAKYPTDDPMVEIAILGEYGHAISGPTVAGPPPNIDQSWRQRPEVVAALGPVGLGVAGHPNIFPSCLGRDRLWPDLAADPPRSDADRDLVVYLRRPQG